MVLEGRRFIKCSRVRHLLDWVNWCASFLSHIEILINNSLFFKDVPVRCICQMCLSGTVKSIKSVQQVKPHVKRDIHR